MRTVEQRVAFGASWLDKERPGWEREVDLASLEMTSSCRCILGQTWVPKQVLGYDHACRDVAMVKGIKNVTDFMVRRGFMAKSREDWKPLEEAWISLIKERFNTGTLSG